ncbi:MAG: DUF6101 family protein [Bradyrhizobium sp.]
MRRQTQTSGINPAAGSSRAMRHDPLSLPLRFDAKDVRADGGVRQVEIHRERVVLRRAVMGMRMAVNVRVADFIGIGLRGIDSDAQMLALIHRDPSLTVPLAIGADRAELDAAAAMWSEIFGLPQLPDEQRREPAARRRRRNVVAKRRPRFLVRRRAGDVSRELSNHRGEREIIARD